VGADSAAVAGVGGGGGETMGTRLLRQFEVHALL
jgi:hypothetical protein